MLLLIQADKKSIEKIENFLENEIGDFAYLEAGAINDTAYQYDLLHAHGNMRDEILEDIEEALAKEAERNGV